MCVFLCVTVVATIGFPVAMHLFVLVVIRLGFICVWCILVVVSVDCLGVCVCLY